MQTTKNKLYRCAETRRTVTIVQLIEWVSGIGDEGAEPIVLAETCTRASNCPRFSHCSLVTEDQ